MAAKAGGREDVRGLALYGYPQCPYCRRVLGAIEALDLDVPLRNTMQESERRRELVEATGRGQVPVLRIESADGDVEWMPESEDIVRYLEERFGER
ncbi:MAG: glutathione S-transferase N-terminal domain-containing protein [Spirochaetaceae bacterium]|nr:glutathione S-transferase N-terminal domain-containing protein [Myxococcales bacterium]MCB9725772.1 glutathione S-transferase N-terminal domain-containing protein [Spirochaetaceae bacterium]HPG25196.1 glutathione S-transferase N-terminal domain-containing protein [Myxococcota bacterium]